MFKGAIPCFIGREPYYLYGGKFWPKAELEKDYERIQKKDRKSGYRDRMNGYYDKWYRYNRSDEGKAYDQGVLRAQAESRCPDTFHIIDVIEACPPKRCNV